MAEFPDSWLFYCFQRSLLSADEGYGDREGLTVLQTPKGVSLKEAVWEAAAIQKHPSYSRTSSRPSSSASGVASTADGSGTDANAGKPQRPEAIEPSPWGELLSNLAEGGKAGTPTRLARAGAGAVPSQLCDAAAAEKIESNTLRPESASYITPPTIPALPVADAPTDRGPADMKTPPASAAAIEKTPGATGSSFLSNLRIDVSYTPSMAAIPTPTAEASCGIPLSPAPMLTPGAPPSVPVELRAAAAERLWPLLAPFAPHMLRDDILTPPNQRRFVRSIKNSTNDSISTLPPQPSLQQCFSLDLDHNQDAFAQHHTHSHHSTTPSTWRLDTEMKAESISFQAAIAIADISGFTSLTEALTRTGPGGVELLTRCMNSYFAQVIDLVTLHGGDVSKFAGDAMLIVFAPTKEEIATAAANISNDGGLGAATRRATVAAKELVDKFGVMSMLSTGEAIAVPRTQVVRQGSKFVRQPSATGASDVASEGSLLRRGASVGFQTAVSFNRKAAKTGQKVARTAAYMGTMPLQAGSKALSGPLRIINSGINYLDLAKNNTSGGSSSTNGNGKKRRYPCKGGEEEEELWMDWLEEEKEDGGVRGGSKDTLTSTNGSASLRTTITKTRSASDILDLAKKADVVGRLKTSPAAAAVGQTEDHARGDEKQRNHPTEEEEEAQIIRAIHQSTLTGLAEAFLGGTLLKVRPPPLPVRPLSEEQEQDDGGTPTALETAAAPAAAASGILPSSGNTHTQQQTRPKSAPGTIYTTTYAHDSFIGRQDVVDNIIDSLSLQRTPSDASVVSAAASMTSNASSMAMRNRTNSFGSFTNVDGVGYNNLVDRGPIAPRLPSVSEREVDGGGGRGGEVAWPSTVRKLVARAFRFGPSQEANEDNNNSSLHPSRVNSVDGAGGGGTVRRQGSTYSSTTTSQFHPPYHQNQRSNSAFSTSEYPSSVYSATSRDGGDFSSMMLFREDLKQRVLHPTASKSAPTSPQNSPPGSPRSSAYGGGQDVPGPTQSSFSFGAGGLGYRDYSTTAAATPERLSPPLTGQDSAPLNFVTDGLPDDLLSLKVTLAAGTLCAYRVGGVLEPTTEGCPEAARWEFFVADADDNEEVYQENIEKKKEQGGHSGNSGGGEKTPTDTLHVKKTCRGPIKQLKETECHASSGNVVVSKEVAHVLARDAELIKFSDGAAELIMMMENGGTGGNQMRSRPGLNSQIMTECIRLSSLSPQERVDAYQVSTRAFTIRCSFIQNTCFYIFLLSLQILRSHVPFNVRSRVESGHIDSVNEVRVCTVVFLGFPSLDTQKSGGPAESLAAVQSVTQAAQGRMHQDGGFFLQMRCDEKGYIALCAFGLPGRSHEDSPARGVQAALAVVSNLQRQGYAAVAGVTTGNLFCGVVGSSRRAEYTVFGDAINFAARLMVRASKNPELGPVLCDEPTRWMAAPVADYTALDSVPVKGRAQPLRAFKVSPRDQWTVTGMTDVVFDDSPVLPQFLNAAQKEHDRNMHQQQQEDHHQQQQDSVEKGMSKSGLPPLVKTTATTTLQKKEAAVKNHDLLLKATQEIMLNKGNPTEPSSDVHKFGDSVQRNPLQITTNSFAPLVGREKELSAAGSRLADLVDGRGGGALFVEGGTGVGKSRLIEEIAWGEGFAPLRQRCIVIASAGRAMRQSEPLNPWRRVFRMIFNIDIERSAKRRALAGEEGGVSSTSFSSAFSKEQGFVASDLAVRLAQNVPDYAVWRPVIASALGLRVEELPVALAGAAQRASAARRGGLFAVDDVSVLLKARAHTFNHVPASDLAVIDAIIKDSDDGIASKGEESGLTLRIPDDSSSSRSFSAAQCRIQYSGISVSARNLDPGRPDSSASNHNGASLDSQGGASSAIHVSNKSGAGGTARPALPPAEMSPQLRALKMRGLLVAIVREFVAAHAPLFIVFDDVHLFDGLSWRLLLAMLTSCQKEVLFMCTLRPVIPLPSAKQTPSLPLGLDAPRYSSKSHQLPLPKPGEMPTTPIGPNGLPSAAPGGIGPDEVFSRKLAEYYEGALWRDGSERITLKNFSLEETGRFISESLVDGSDVPWAATQLLYEKSAGMPAYLQQMCLFFKIRAQEIARGRPTSGTAPTIISSAAVAAAAGMPSSVLSADASMVEVARVGMDFVRATVNVHSIVPARVDRLRPDEQLTLKVASVMGATVYSDLLQAAHPKNPSMRRLQANLQALAAAGFLTKQSDLFGGGGGRSRDPLLDRTSNSTWQFTDVLGRDIVWDMIPLTQRREWQARLAAAMARFGNNNTPAAASAGGGGGGGANSYSGFMNTTSNKSNPYSGRRAIPPAIIAYHWSQAALGVETTEWQATLQAIDWWERAASEASLSGSFDEEVSLLHNATIMANALVQPHPTGSFNARPDLVVECRRARWERCAAAALLLSDGENTEDEHQTIAASSTAPLPCSAVRIKGVPLHGNCDSQKASIVHCLRALYLLHVPMPWSEEYQKASEKAIKLEKSSKAVKLLKNLAGRVKIYATQSIGTRKKNNDTSYGALPDSTSLIRATLAGDFATLAKLEPEKDDGFHIEQTETLIAVAMLAAVVAASSEWQLNFSNYRYILWICEYLAGGPRRIQQGSALYIVREHVRVALRRAKGCGGHASRASSRHGCKENSNYGDGGGDGHGQQLRSLKEAFSLQRIRVRATK